MLPRYNETMSWALRQPRFMLGLPIANIALNIYLFVIVPTAFFPQQDTGRLIGSIQAAQDTSFQAMRQKLMQVVEIIKNDPAVESVTGFSGGGAGGTTTKTRRMFIRLKPLHAPKLSAGQGIARL